uniref:ankyrin repeat domain-containing protein 17 isoform X3 n=1 Tax=Ciona intestinalis TaxID=7719 RepID=UPI00089DD5E7|nr:ankyrin repeat domain-containing protein 17 isoform X3 [Ciona intestinalis]|eukprot:XP_018668743.1 ankyrin repeat domain-containing protein 17 isoform X3 [Ciona intestinalis]
MTSQTDDKMSFEDLLSWRPPQPTINIDDLCEIERFLFGNSVAVSEAKINKEIESFILEQEAESFDSDHSALASKLAMLAATGHVSTGEGTSDDQISVDAETQARLEALLEAAGIGKLSTSDGKAFADPEVLRRLSSSVSCALDEAAAALSKMKQETGAMNEQSNKRSLVEACSEGDVGTVRALLCEGRSANETTEDGESLLSLACSAGYYELAEVLLSVPPYTHESQYLTCDAGYQLGNKINSHFLSVLNQQLTKVLLTMHANVEDCGAKGECTPLMEASSGGYSDIVRLLLSHGADVNATSNTGNTALTYACCGGYEDVVRLLVDAGAELECHNENGHTPLMEAASGGHVAVAEVLLARGAGINTHSNEFKESALTLACYKGHLQMVRFLLQAGADQEHKTDEMHTALMEASMDGHVEVARLLLDSGAQVNMPADSFESPLTLAACGGHVELAELLIQRGAALEEVNDEGYTPLMEAAREGHEEMVALLLAKGANVNAKTEETQETALTLACCGGFLECADLLVRAGANIETGCSTPLMEAAQEGQLDLVKFLIREGANVHSTTSSGDTALSYACEHGHTDVADHLLAAGANLEHETEGGRTPLMKAARAGHLCTVQFLISRGADVNRTTRNNEHSVLSLACVCGHLSVVELLLCQGADPMHKLKDGSTMLLEAAKGGHTQVVQFLLDFPINIMSLLPDNSQVTLPSPTPEQLAPRVPTQSLPMVVPPQEPDEAPELPLAVGGAGVDPVNVDQMLEASGENAPNQLRTLYQQQLQYYHQQTPSHSHTDSTLNTAALVTHLLQQGSLLYQASDYLSPDTKLEVDKDVAITVESFLRSMASDVAAGKTRTAESIVEEAQGKLNELEHRIKEAIEKNAQLKSIEMLQTDQLTKEKVEELYKTREEQIHKKQKILEELQKNREMLTHSIFADSQVERELQLKTQQQLKKHYLEMKQGEGQQRGKPDGEDREQTAQNAKVNDDPQPQVQRERNQTASTTQTPELSTKQLKQPKHQNNQTLNNGSSGSLSQPAKENDPFCQCLHPPCSQLSHPQTEVHPEPRHDPNTPGGPGFAPIPGNIPGNVTPSNFLEIDGHTESNHDTPLTLACAGGHEDLVQLLIERGANIEHRDKKGFTPLILAATAGHVGAVQILLEANSDIEAQSERTKDTPLSLACSGGRLEVVELLLERSANKEHRNVSDYTPLSLAASGGYVNIIKVLLNRGAEINSRTGSKLGISPLMLAAMNGHTQAVQLLLDMGADINAQIETNRNTALTLACFQGRHEVVSLLVDRKANVEHRAKTGLTPLMEAASGGYAEVGRVLLDKGADPNAAPVPSSRDTALTIAADKGHYRFCELVLSRGAQVEVRNKKGNTPLWLACNGGHLDVVNLLVSKGADVNAADNRNVIPLMAAFRKGHVQVVRWLAKEVSQFPSDAECMRYIATISDRELLKRSHQCMECIVQAKDRQAQEANKFASELLEELDMEKNQEESRKEKAARKREKKRLKRKQKKKGDEKDDKENDESAGLNIPTNGKTPNDDITMIERIVTGTEKIKLSDSLISTSSNEKITLISNASPAPSTAPPAIDPITRDQVPKPKVPMAPLVSEGITRNDERRKSLEMKRRPIAHPVVENNHTATTDTSPRSATGRKQRKTLTTSTTTKQPSREMQSPKPSPRPVPSQRNPPPTPSPGKRGSRREEGWKEVVPRKYVNSSTSKRIMVSSNLISRVIGRGGCNINAIREVTGAHIDIDKQRKGAHERTVTIKGGIEPTRHAHQLIVALIKEDRSDQEVAAIIAKAQAQAAQNAAVKVAPQKPTMTVVAAPMPTKPAWTVPPSIIANTQQTQPKPAAPSTKIGVWAPPPPTTTATSSAQELQTNKWVPTTSPEQATKTSPTVETAKKALFFESQTPLLSTSVAQIISSVSSSVSFVTKSSDKVISKPIQPVAPMMSTKVTSAAVTRVTPYGAVPGPHHPISPSQVTPVLPLSVEPTKTSIVGHILPRPTTSPISHPISSQQILPQPSHNPPPPHPASSAPGVNNPGANHMHSMPTHYQDNKQGTQAGFASVISDVNSTPSYSPFNNSFTPSAGPSVLWNHHVSSYQNQSSMNGPVQVEPVDQSKAPGYRGSMKSPVVENGILGTGGNVDTASPQTPEQGSPSNDNEVTPKPMPIGTERAHHRRANQPLPMTTVVSQSPANIWNFADLSLTPSKIGVEQIDSGKYPNWSPVIQPGTIEGTMTTSTNNKPQVTVLEVEPSMKQTPIEPQPTNNPQVPVPLYYSHAPPVGYRSNRLPSTNRFNTGGLGTQPPIGSHLGGSGSVGVVGPQQSQLQPIGSHLGGSGHVRSNAAYQQMHHNIQSSQVQQQQQQQQRYQMPFYMQTGINRYGQSMQELNWQQQQQQQSLYQQSRHINPYEQHKELAANSGMYNSIPSQYGGGLQNNDHGVIPAYPSGPDGGSYPIPHDAGYNRGDPYFENEYVMRGIPHPNTNDSWNQCRPQQQSYQMNGSESSNVIGGHQAMDGEQTWKEW